VSPVELDDCTEVNLLTGWAGPKDLTVSHRTSWGILPKIPVFSPCSARCVTGRACLLACLRKFGILDIGPYFASAVCPLTETIWRVVRRHTKAYEGRSSNSAREGSHTIIYSAMKRTATGEKSLSIKIFASRSLVEKNCHKIQGPRINVCCG
jgi:hypothetical protein